MFCGGERAACGKASEAAVNTMVGMGVWTNNDKSGDKAAEASKLVDGLEEGSRSRGRRADCAIAKKTREAQDSFFFRSPAWQDRPLYGRAQISRQEGRCKD